MRACRAAALAGGVGASSAGAALVWASALALPSLALRLSLAGFFLASRTRRAICLSSCAPAAAALSAHVARLHGRATLTLAPSTASIAELTALGVPAILVPSPNVTNHHQEKNAALLGNHGAALVLPEEGLDGKKLFAAAAGILNDPQRMETMSQNMAALGIPDATKRIYDTVMTLLK